MKSGMFKVFWGLIGIGLFVISVLVVLRWRCYQDYQPHMYLLDQAPKSDVGIVFGAGLKDSQTPSSALYERVWVGAQLYHQGKIKFLLLSGDNRRSEYNEPAVMGAVARQLGVPEDALIYDYAGRRSYDTCYRAVHIFGVKQALVISQRFHLPRILMLSNDVGLSAQGVYAEKIPFSMFVKISWELRELLALPLAWLNMKGISLKSKPL